MRKELQTKAFTLIELLVVISIILIAFSIIFIGGSGGDGVALSSSQRIVSGIAQGARGQAILKNAETRLIIHNDPAEIDKYRRFIGIVYLDEEEDGWLAATQGTYLPDGIYFDPTLSNSFSLSTMNLNFPQSIVGQNTDPVSGGGSTSYYYYKFNSNGTSANANQWLAIRAGNLTRDGTLADYDPAGEDAFLKAALIFRKSGTTTMVQDPDDI
jgi:prepilin-type N-terminal cleavage/methylation domain-containing protein